MYFKNNFELKKIVNNFINQAIIKQNLKRNHRIK